MLQGEMYLYLYLLFLQLINRLFMKLTLPMFSVLYELDLSTLMYMYVSLRKVCL